MTVKTLLGHLIAGVSHFFFTFFTFFTFFSFPGERAGQVTSPLTQQAPDLSSRAPAGQHEPCESKVPAQHTPSGPRVPPEQASSSSHSTPVYTQRENQLQEGRQYIPA